MVFKNIKTEFGAIQKAVSELDIADGQFTNSITDGNGLFAESNLIVIATDPPPYSVSL